MFDVKLVLKSFGLNDKEVDIYLALLKFGSAQVSLLSHYTGISRSTVQYECKHLEKFGVIKSIRKGNVVLYVAKSPQELFSILSQRKIELERMYFRVQNIMGDLVALQGDNSVVPNVSFFEGVSGIIDILEDTLKENTTLYSVLKLEDKSEIHPELWEYFSNEYIEKRKELKNETRSIFNDNQASRDYRKLDAEMNRVTLLLPTNEFPFEACSHIYGNKVAFCSYKLKDLTGVIIENEFISKMQFSLFKGAWNYALSLDINKKYKDYVI